MDLIAVITLIIVFLSSYFLILISFIKNKFVKKNFHLIIPCICIIIWALSALISKNYNATYRDFIVFYEAGKIVITTPAKLYDFEKYYYTPLFACLFGISLSLLPLNIAAYVFLIFNIFFGFLSAIEFDKILRLMNVKKKIFRLMFLLVITNGRTVFVQFGSNQSKYIVFVIILYILRRYLSDVERNLRYYVINYSLFIFAVGLAPYFIFLLLIYIFQDIKIKDVLKKMNIKKYLLVLLIFSLENFLFLIYPTLFIDFISKGTTWHRNNDVFYYVFAFELSDYYLSLYNFLAIIVFTLFSLFLVVKKKIKLTDKYGYFGFLFILVGVFSHPILLYLFLLTFILLMFIPYFNEEEKNFFNNNFYVLLALIAIAIFCFVNDYRIFEARIYHLYPINYFYKYVIKYRFYYLMSIILFSLFMVRYKSSLQINNV